MLNVENKIQKSKVGDVLLAFRIITTPKIDWVAKASMITAQVRQHGAIALRGDVDCEAVQRCMNTWSNTLEQASLPQACVDLF